MLESKVGLEAEFLLMDSKDKVVIPPSSWDRDGFPLLGEVRGDCGDNTPDVVANFNKKLMEITAKVKKGSKIVMEDIIRIHLAVYKAAMKQVTEAKGEQVGKVKNIHGIKIEDYSDQVLKDGKIQGINSSCGLHIHFSCREIVSKVIEDAKYTLVTLPIKLAEVSGENAILTELIRPEIHLYSRECLPDNKKKKVGVFASVLTKPVVEYIVKEMDDAFFERFAPEKENRTKYRRPGFYELKPYGFEYRSLPANNATMAALPEIVDKALGLLNSLNTWT